MLESPDPPPLDRGSPTTESSGKAATWSATSITLDRRARRAAWTLSRRHGGFDDMAILGLAERVRGAARRAGLVGSLLVALAGCGSGDDAPFEPQRHLELEITSDQEFSQLVLMWGDTTNTTSGVVTPGMLATGTQPAARSVVYQVLSTFNERFNPTRVYRHRFIYPGPSFNKPRVVFAITYRRTELGELVPSSAGMANDPYSSTDDVQFTGTLSTTAAGLRVAELWGARQQCARYTVGVFFLDDNADKDCDGIDNDDDCNPDAFCDPAATSPEALAGCSLSRCARCELDGDSCALGTRLTCHDVHGQPRSYTCDAGADCGPTTVCLPANACQLQCHAPIDPVACMESTWRDGAQATDAIDCRLPTQGDQRTCPGGSRSEVALPFTGCAAPSVVVDYSTDLTATATLSPPCTLRVALDSTHMLIPQPVLVTMTTATGSATVHLMLHPTSDACGSVGVCDPVPSAATCEL